MKAVSADLINTVVRDEQKLRMNPYDIKILKDTFNWKKNNKCKITCLCMGSLDAVPALKSCYGYGADEIILLNDPAFVGSDTYATSYILSKAIEKIGDYDFVLCGEKAVDGETGQVAGSIAEHLQVVYIPAVGRLFSLYKDKAELELRDETGITTVEVSGPAVLHYKDFDTTELTIGLAQIKKIRNKMPVIWNMSDLELEAEYCGHAGSKTKVIEVKKVEYNKKNGKILEGMISDQVEEINQLIMNNRLG